MPDTKIGNNRWVPDIRTDKVKTFNDNEKEYKIVDVHPILNKTLDEDAFFRTHAQAVYYSLADEKTVAEIIKEQQSTIEAQQATIQAQQTEITSLKTKHQEDIDALKTEIALAAPDRYQGVEITDSWETIQKNIKAGDFKNYRVGDYKTIHLTDTNEIVRPQIAGIDTYYRTTNVELGHHIDWISKDCIEGYYQWNTENNNNGTSTERSPYMNSSIRTYLNNTVFSKLPTDLQKVIVDKKILMELRYSSDTTKINDSNSWDWREIGKLWLPTEYEVFGSTVWGTKGWSAGQSIQYPLFANNWLRRIKGNGDGGGRCTWWLCTVASEDSTRCCFVGYAGYAIYNLASASYGVPVCFRIS